MSSLACRRHDDALRSSSNYLVNIAHTLFHLLIMDFEDYSKRFKEAALSDGYEPHEIDALLKYASLLADKDIPIIYDQQHLSYLVGYAYAFLLAVSNSQELYYKQYRIPKKNGGTRLLEEPYPSLKEIQHWILKNILQPIAIDYVSPVAKAFIPHKTLRENARFHKGKNCVVALDLHDFFGSIHFGAVYGIFSKIGYNKAVSIMLTNLCIYHDSLPQGAPTSPLLSNLVFKHIDDKIFNYCRKRGIAYTRYADDMTFSGDNIQPKRIISYVKMITERHRFSLNEEKTNVMKKGMRQNVTGVITNQKLQVSREYRDKVRQEIYYSIKYGFADHFKRIKDLPKWIQTPDSYVRYLYGKVNFILQINPKDITFLRYKEWLKDILNNGNQ